MSKFQSTRSDSPLKDQCLALTNDFRQLIKYIYNNNIPQQGDTLPYLKTGICVTFLLWFLRNLKLLHAFIDIMQLYLKFSLNTIFVCLTIIPGLNWFDVKYYSRTSSQFPLHTSPTAILPYAHLIQI